MEAERCGCTCSQNMFHHSCSSTCKCVAPGGGWTIPVNVSKYCNQGFVKPMKCIILTSSPNLQSIHKRGVNGPAVLETDFFAMYVALVFVVRVLCEIIKSANDREAKFQVSAADRVSEDQSRGEPRDHLLFKRGKVRVCRGGAHVVDEG